jgi:hypothetical protein
MPKKPRDYKKRAEAMALRLRWKYPDITAEELKRVMASYWEEKRKERKRGSIVRQK